CHDYILTTDDLVGFSNQILLRSRPRQRPREAAMSERDGFQHGVPCWVDTWQDDGEAGARFYSELLGWEIEGGDVGDGRSYRMCNLRRRNAAGIGSPRPAGVAGAPAWTTYVWVDDVDGALATAIEAGGSAVLEPFESLDGGRMALIEDPQGAVFGIWRPGEHRGAQVVNEFGAWSMSPLQSPDPEASKRFYAAVFGWVDERFGTVSLCGSPGTSAASPSSPSPATWSRG
ncbi:MAG: VOC family protein, partial [Solirubrobacterales bacterium]